MSPIWRRLSACDHCGGRAIAHLGQRNGLRRRKCRRCGWSWIEAPIGYHAIRDGVEILVPTDLLDAAAGTVAHHIGAAASAAAE